MESPALTLFNEMTDEDFMAVHDAGQLKNFCHALSFDLEVNNKYKNLPN
tara:strand:- start:1415 stop:1561 length:147 start_codon:yes stop_codon:yes gene_type:complete